MTPLPSSRVPLLLETTKNPKPACSAAKIRGRAAFWLLIGCSGALCKSRFWENLIDRLRAKFRSIDFSGSPNFQSFPYEICHSSLIVLQKQKTQKLTKTLENNKAKGLTSANQGVQIHNIWHSSLATHPSSSSSTDEQGIPYSLSSCIAYEKLSSTHKHF
jgi:hypothetical protein